MFLTWTSLIEILKIIRTILYCPITVKLRRAEELIRINSFWYQSALKNEQINKQQSRASGAGKLNIFEL